MRFLLTRHPEVDEFQDVVPDEFQVSMSLRASARRQPVDASSACTWGVADVCDSSPRQSER